MNFIITGGAGFIGSHLVETLLADNHKIFVIDDLSTGKVKNLPNHHNLSFLEADILTGLPQSSLNDYDGLAHLAATPSVAQSWLSPLAAHQNNLSTTVAAIQLCHQLNIPRLVFSSSAAVYGNPKQTTISETMPTAPLSPYGLQKLTSEQYITLFSKQFGITAVNLRLFNVFGPRQVADSPYSGAISIFTKAMKENKPIHIYGDGHQTRDFVYVKDVVLGFKKALTLPLLPKSSSIFNIGQGKTTSILQLIDTLKTCIPRWSAGIEFRAPRIGDVRHSQANITQASLQLKFIPQWSLHSGLEATVKSQDV